MTRIPGPPELPFIGNVADIKNTEVPLWSLLDLAEEYGEIYQLRFPGQNPVVFVNTQALTDEICNEKRFQKRVGILMTNLRKGLREGIFSSRTDEETWGIAHRILMPAFGPISLTGMFDEMLDVASQMALKWARHAGEPINVSDDFTRLTLDTIALSGFGYRFNSFYLPSMHPYIEALQGFLIEADNMSRRLPIPGMFYRDRDRQFQANIDQLRTVAEQMLAKRQQDPVASSNSDRKDLLQAMIDGIDPQTGKKLSDTQVIDNIISFLSAGHETTGGMLSFVFYELLRHPSAYRAAQNEVDSVCGKGPITAHHMQQLGYLAAVLRETLRLHATIPGFMVEALEDTTIGPKQYPVKKGHTITCLLGAVHTDRAVYGDDAREFRPERMLEKEFTERSRNFPNSWKPFGNGVRACIGRPFAWQESLLICAVLLQNFDFELWDPEYTLQVRQAITIKPKDFQMRVRLRGGLTPTTLEHRLAGRLQDHTTNISASQEKEAISARQNCAESQHGPTSIMETEIPIRALKPLTILFGSESGTCESLARRLAADAPTHGLSAVAVDCLDSWDPFVADKASPDGIHHIVIITASYEGQPPANAHGFVKRVESLLSQTQSQLNMASAKNESLRESEPFSRVAFAVYGCGDRAWAQTFHRVPKLIDSALEQLGAQRVAPLGLSDVAAGKVFADFEAWEDDVFWPALAAERLVRSPMPTSFDKTSHNCSLNAPVSCFVGSDKTAKENDFAVTVATAPRSSGLGQYGFKQAVVVSNRPLTSPSCPNAKQHLEVCLPDGMEYRPGDHLAVMPFNRPETVRRVLRLFNLCQDASIEISGTVENSIVGMSLPTGINIPAWDFLSTYVELDQVATKRNILSLISSSACPSTKTALSDLLDSPHNLMRQSSILDLLECFGDIRLPVSFFISMLAPLRPRLYSISSSPSSSSSHATLTYSLLRFPSSDAKGMSPAGYCNIGVATSYMAGLQPGDSISISMRPSHGAFHLPDHRNSESASKPLICIAAGAGLAPFRGFIQERRALLSTQSPATGNSPCLEPMLLFFGCRHPELDDLYREELDKWERDGAVTVFRSYSRNPDHVDSAGCKYVQHRLAHEWEQVKRLWSVGAVMYVCGSRKMAAGVRGFMIKMKASDEGWSEARAEDWFRVLGASRFVTDLFD